MGGKRKLKEKKERTAKLRKLEEQPALKEVSIKLDEMETLSKGRWRNRQKVLVFCSRGISYKGRHLMKDLMNLLPHSKSDIKLKEKHDLLEINEICEIKHCNKCIFLLGKKKRDVYMWLSNVPHGPSALFHVEYLNMMQELKFSGNCLKGSRPVLSFDKEFDKTPHMQVVKELFIQMFGTPRYHPKSQPFIDHVLTFSLWDGKVWFRNFQIVKENGELTEIGPRFTLTLARIFSGSFCKSVLYINPDYKSPNLIRHLKKKKKSESFFGKKAAEADYAFRRTDKTYPVDETNQVFAQ